MIKLAVIGAGGRMGSRIVALAKEKKVFEVICGLEKKGHPLSGKDVEGIKISTTMDNIFMCDVVIDFTLAEAAMDNLKFVTQYKKPLVLGTTGLDTEQINMVKKASDSVPVVFTPNFSIGVNVLFKQLAGLYKSLGPEYDIEIVEAHHDKKKDAPSGTAKKMVEVLSSVSGKNIPTHSIRLGDIIGDHTVIFSGNSERIEVTHRANSRDLFVRGALKAAEWVVKQPPGLYTMSDVLG